MDASGSAEYPTDTSVPSYVTDEIKKAEEEAEIKRKVREEEENMISVKVFRGEGKVDIPINRNKPLRELYSAAWNLLYPTVQSVAEDHSMTVDQVKEALRREVEIETEKRAREVEKEKAKEKEKEKEREHVEDVEVNEDEEPLLAKDGEGDDDYEGEKGGGGSEGPEEGGESSGDAGEGDGPEEETEEEGDKTTTTPKPLMVEDVDALEADSLAPIELFRLRSYSTLGRKLLSPYKTEDMDKSLRKLYISSFDAVSDHIYLEHGV